MHISQRIAGLAGVALLLTSALATSAFADTYSTQSNTQYSTQNGYSNQTTVQTPQGTQTYNYSFPAQAGASFPSMLPPVNVTVPPFDIFGNGAASSQNTSAVSSSSSTSASSVTPESSSASSMQNPVTSVPPIPFLNPGLPFTTLEQEIQSLEQRVAQLEAEVAALEQDVGTGSSSSSSPTVSTSYHATLTANQQVPPVSSSGSGVGTFTLSGSNLSYHIAVQNLTSPIVASHFHLGAAGQNGSILQPISFSGSMADGIWNNLTQDQINDLNNGMIYVNVHTSNYPDGEIRGQILP